MTSFSVKYELGRLGEEIVKRFCREQYGLTVYAPEGNHGAEPADFFTAKLTQGERPRIYLNDAKTKWRRAKYPDTGIDLKHYRRYQETATEYGVPYFLWFVDAFEERVFGNFLEVLETRRRVGSVGYPVKHGAQIYFPLEVMMVLDRLPKETCESLRRQRTSRYGDAYANTPRFFDSNNGLPVGPLPEFRQFDWTKNLSRR